MPHSFISIDWFMKTYSAKVAEVEHEWVLIDATNKTLGRLVSRIAMVLRGKHKPEFTPHVDTGDYVVVINAEKIRVTGRKEQDKVYYRHTGYPGGIRSETLGNLRERKPEDIILKAAKGMLPRGPLGYAMLKKLKVYAGNEHPHTSQTPRQIEL